MPRVVIGGAAFGAPSRMRISPGGGDSSVIGIGRDERRFTGKIREIRLEVKEVK